MLSTMQTYRDQIRPLLDEKIMPSDDFALNVWFRRMLETQAVSPTSKLNPNSPPFVPRLNPTQKDPYPPSAFPRMKLP